MPERNIMDAINKFGLCLISILINYQSDAQNLIARKFSSLITPTSINQGLNGCHLVTGITYSSTLGVQGAVILVDSSFNLIASALPGNGNIRTFGAYQRANGNIVQLSTSDYSKFWFTEYDSTLNLILNKKWEDTQVTGSCNTTFTFNNTRSRFVFNQSLTNGVNSPVLLCFDTSGNVVWQKLLIHSPGFLIKKMQPANDGGYYLLGNVNDSSGEKNMLIVKTDLNGNIVWNKSIGTTVNKEEALSIIELANNELITVGYLETDTGNYHIKPSEMLIVKLDSSQNIIWSNRMMINNWSYADAVTLDTNGLVVAGHFYYSIGASVYSITGEGLILRLDTAGNLMQAHTLGNQQVLKHFVPIEFFQNNSTHGLLVGRLGYHSDSFLFSLDNQWIQACSSFTIQPTAISILLDEPVISISSVDVLVLSQYSDSVAVYTANGLVEDFCQPLSLSEHHDDNPLSVNISYFANEIVIDVSQFNNYTFTLHDSALRAVSNSALKNNYSKIAINKSLLSKGVYVLTIITPEGKSVTSKIVVF